MLMDVPESDGKLQSWVNLSLEIRLPCSSMVVWDANSGILYGNDPTSSNLLNKCLSDNCVMGKIRFMVFPFNSFVEVREVSVSIVQCCQRVEASVFDDIRNVFPVIAILPKFAHRFKRAKL